MNVSRIYAGLALAAAAGLGMAHGTGSAMGTMTKVAVDHPVPRKQRVKRERVRPRHALRSRGPQAHPKRKANRMHISKRTRRKHRRARK